MLYSDHLDPYIGPIPQPIAEAIITISQYFGINPKVLTYDNTYVAIPVLFNVPLPSRGTVNGIDIREKEPMLIRFDLEDYPNIAPYILSDRKDFPRQKLSHLYFSKPGHPGRLCLVRQSPNEWFAKITFINFLDVGAQWLYKAATGNLDEDGNEFDPTRLEGNVGSDHIYRYEIFNKIAEKDLRFSHDYPMAIFRGKQITSRSSITSYKTDDHVQDALFQNLSELINEIDKKKKEDDNILNFVFSFLFWNEKDIVEEGYHTGLPENYGELKIFFQDRGIDLQSALLFLESKGAIKRRGIAITLAIRRSKKMIGYNGNFEFFSFTITVPEKGVNAFLDDSEVWLMTHKEPLSISMANEISAKSYKKSVLFIGAGSLGSKMILHDARSGQLKIGICDNDSLLPHNLVRHELFASDLGSNKAQALADLIKDFYTSESTSNIYAYPYNVTFIKDKLLAYDTIIDTTASEQVQNFLLRSSFKGRYLKAEIADQGRLGFFYSEGAGRNPRMDDLVNYGIFLATQETVIENWRRNDAKQEFSTLNVGLGCSSTTSVMANDTIAFHASIFAGISQRLNLSDNPEKNGLLYYSSINTASIAPVIFGKEFTIEPFETLNCLVGSGWQFRMISGTSARLISIANEKAPKETGGILIGMANYKTKTVHVFDVIAEPDGSSGTRTTFIRGIDGLSEEIDVIKETTGNIIGYIGEWHSHPMNLRRLSTTDLQTIEKLKPTNRRVPIPTCAIVVTPYDLLGYIYE